MDDWHWLFLGVGAGYLVGKYGGNVAENFNLSVQAGFNKSSSAANAMNLGLKPGKPSGSGYLPFDQPNGSEPYTSQGTYNPDLSGGFPQYITPGSSGNKQFSGGKVG